MGTGPGRSRSWSDTLCCWPTTFSRIQQISLSGDRVLMTEAYKINVMLWGWAPPGDKPPVVRSRSEWAELTGYASSAHPAAGKSCDVPQLGFV